jgi:hypothetical protein
MLMTGVCHANLVGSEIIPMSTVGAPQLEPNFVLHLNILTALRFQL